ncbi:MAG: radical SAM family heme chaperone HemW, partial [Clostridiaceae bacterium]|nr:radical SAM family heme chaperone HemW [Clostridiaceae bacterium]
MDKSIGLYFHVPFCKSKCYYCDFNSYSGMDYLAGSYFDALYSELDRRLDTIEDRPVRSIFIGGGTPSLVEPKYITRLLELCSKHLQLDGEAEISMESNPGTLNFENLKAYKQAGVNRLSIGLQAWQDRLLKELGRIHDRDQFVKNIEAACKAGFSNINADLIFGLPGQSFEDWKETLEAVTSLKHGDGSPVLKHLSCYDLKIEEGTVLGDRLKAGTLTAAEDELDRRMYQYTIEMLSDKGFHQYEISNFARPGYECRHNLVYWKAQEYAGFGAGSHSYLDGYRFSNV